MLHKRAAQRADGTGWHYVIGKGQRGTPIGDCANHAPHATEAEARECYAQFVRESIRLNAGKCGWTSCRACCGPADQVAHYGDDGYGAVALCAEHMTTEHVIAAAHLDQTAGDAWVS